MKQVKLKKQFLILFTFTQESLEMLRESATLLQYEPNDQPEGILFERAVRQLEQFTKYLPRIIPGLNLQPNLK